MLFKYKALDKTGTEQEGTIETVNEDTAIAALQRNGLVITSVVPADKKDFLHGDIAYFEHVSAKEVVILSRQLATLFEAQVSALRIFRLLGSEAANPLVRKTLSKVSDDIQAGSSISKALSKHPKVFSSFYCNMVLAGEETGRLEQTFNHLAEYIDRSYAVTSKAKHALVYPAFIIFTFIVIMVLMLVMVIPKLTEMIKEASAEIPIYTKIVMGFSDFFINYGLLLFVFLVFVVITLWRYALTPQGRRYFDRLKLDIPLIGSLYQKLFLARLAENLSTMLSSGIAMVQAIDITSAIVENVHYEEALKKARDDIKNGASISKAFSEHPEIPTIMVQMMRVGEETGELSNILKTLAKFYTREVENTVDTLIGMLEPIMIILLAGGVGVLVASVILPIYSITSSIT
jgi:type II secretory pathway component PulF